MSNFAGNTRANAQRPQPIDGVQLTDPVRIPPNQPAAFNPQQPRDFSQMQQNPSTSQPSRDRRVAPPKLFNFDGLRQAMEAIVDPATDVAGVQINEVAFASVDVLTVSYTMLPEGMDFYMKMLVLAVGKILVREKISDIKFPTAHKHDEMDVKSTTDDGVSIFDPEKKTQYTTEIVLALLKMLQIADSDKTGFTYPTGQVFKPNEVTLRKVYRFLLECLEDSQWVTLVGAVRITCMPHPNPNISNAAKRLVGRGFTALRMIITAISRAKDNDNALCNIYRLLCTYFGELEVFMTTLSELVKKPEIYQFGYYTGLPVTLSSRQYGTLAAIAYRILLDTQLRNYRGFFAQIPLAPNVEQVVQEVRDELMHVTVADFADEMVTIGQATEILGWLDRSLESK